MKIVECPGYVRSPAAQAEMDALVAELRIRFPPKPRPIKPDGMTQEEFVLSLQGPAFHASMSRNDEEQAKWVERLKGPPPDGWKAVPDAKTIEESIGQRNLDPNEISVFETNRRSAKNSLGQSEKSATTQEGKARAIDAILFTPPAKVTKETVERRGVNLIQYETRPMVEEWRPLPWHKAFIHWISGNKIRQEPKGK